MPVITLLIIIFVGFVLYKMIRNLRQKTPTNDELSINNVEAGGMLHLKNIGPEMRSYDVQIISKHIYRQGNYEWYELEGDNGKEKIWLEYEDDDEICVSITLEKLKLRDIGLSKEDLNRIDDEEEGHLDFRGITYYYEDSDDAEFLRHGNSNQAEAFYYWDFESDDGKHFLGVEKWGGNDYEVFYSEAVKLSQISIYSLRK